MQQPKSVAETVVPILSARVQWHPCEQQMPTAMRTMLVACIGDEVQTGYWDGDRWYCTGGYPLEGVAWWAPLPVAPFR